MNAKVKIFCILLLFLFQKSALSNILPTFNLTVKNIQTSPNPYGGDSLIFFDIYCQHTNLGMSDPFEYGSAQFTFWYNKALSQGGVLNAIRNGSDLPLNIQAPSLTIDTTLGVIKTSGNPVRTDANYFISSVFPGTKILRIKLRTDKHTWPIVPLNIQFKLGAAPNTLIGYLEPFPDGTDTELFSTQQFTYLSDTINNVYSVENTLPCFHCFIPPKKINVTALFEGTYDETSNSQSRTDAVVMSLRRAVSPFDLVYSRSAVMDSNTFTGSFPIADFVSGLYYIVMYHPQGIETWSKPGGENIGWVIPNNEYYYYDFTTNSSQAYGNNLKVKGSKYCIYSGDVNQNGNVDLTDVTLIFNDAQNFHQSNSNNTDLNGDKIVDLNDVTIAYNNSSAFVGKISP